MRNVLLIFTALFALSCSAPQKPETIMSPDDAALYQLPEKDPVRKYLTEVMAKSRYAQSICAAKIGQSDGDRAKLDDILGKCAEYQTKLLGDVHRFRGSLMPIQYGKAYATVILELRVLIRFYPGAQMCVKTSRTQKEFDSCIESVTKALRDKIY
jgi:hypothetical protein